MSFPTLIELGSCLYTISAIELNPIGNKTGLNLKVSDIPKLQIIANNKNTYQLVSGIKNKTSFPTNTVGLLTKLLSNISLVLAVPLS